jgi:hypothetical protein
MIFPDWIKSLFSPPTRQTKLPTVASIKPTQQEKRTALNRLDELATPAILGEIGGSKPQKENRAASWWGGNFLGAHDEDIPICKKSGRTMHSVLQIRVDELPEIPPAFEGLALTNIWMDLQSSTFLGGGELQWISGSHIHRYGKPRSCWFWLQGKRRTSDISCFLA